MPPAKNRGRGRFSATEGDDVSEDAIILERELEYDENVPTEESDDSGSDFEASKQGSVEIETEDEEYMRKSRRSPRKQSLPAIDQYLSDDENDEQIMLDVAIQESLQTARLDQTASNGAGPSSRPIAPSNRAAALRAAAAERRLSSANNLEYILSTESEAESSGDEALFKAKASRKSVTIRDTTSTKFMSMSERRKLKKEKRKFNAAANRRGTRKEELAMIRELGRPLTLVRVVETATHIAADGSTLHRRKKRCFSSTNITGSSGTSGVISKKLFPLLFLRRPNSQKTWRSRYFRFSRKVCIGCESRNKEFGTAGCWRYGLIFLSHAHF